MYAHILRQENCDEDENILGSTLLTQWNVIKKNYITAVVAHNLIVGVGFVCFWPPNSLP